MSPSKLCYRCYRSNPPHALYCGLCGTPVRATAPPEFIPRRPSGRLFGPILAMVLFALCLIGGVICLRLVTHQPQRAVRWAPGPPRSLRYDLRQTPPPLQAPRAPHAPATLSPDPQK